MPRKRPRMDYCRREDKFSGVLMTDRLVKVKSFKRSKYHMGVVNRMIPEDAQDFFQKMMVKHPFAELFGEVRKMFCREDLLFLLDPLKLSTELQSAPFFIKWINDMAKVCETFCDVLNTDSVCFWLGMERGCHRFHVDMVDFRLLVTYAGKGTEWVPIGAADRSAIEKCEANDKIVKDKSLVQHANEWDIYIFRGGPDGVVHRSPYETLEEGQSILMRLDLPSFLDILENTDTDTSDEEFSYES